MPQKEKKPREGIKEPDDEVPEDQEAESKGTRRTTKFQEHSRDSSEPDVRRSERKCENSKKVKKKKKKPKIGRASCRERV